MVRPHRRLDRQRREGWVQEIDEIPRFQQSRDHEARPHPAVLPERDVPAVAAEIGIRHFERQQNEREGQPFFLDPGFPQKRRRAEQHPEDSDDERAPSENGNRPATQVLAPYRGSCFPGKKPLITAGSRGAEPGGQVRQDTLGEMVAGTGVVGGRNQLIDHLLDEAVAADTRSPCRAWNRE